jgi:6,7-dimethyl-8-ribityllumazine synthase
MTETNKNLDGDLIVRGTRFGIVLARFNSFIGERLLEGALDTLVRHGAERAQIEVARVPGAFEMPLALKHMAASKKYDALIALGCVIRGETPHFEFVAGEAASGLQLAALETGVPVSFGVLTVENRGQAEARIERGADAVRSALEMADLFGQLRASAARE